MLRAFCEIHSGDVLISSDQVTQMVNTPTGIVVEYRCLCGARGRLVTGARAIHHHSGHVTTGTAAA